MTLGPVFRLHFIRHHPNPSTDTSFRQDIDFDCKPVLGGLHNEYWLEKISA